MVGTTRPETMLGDVAVAVNPRDDRYARYIGRHLWHSFRQQTIPIICDSFVDQDFGTGAVKITPAHDPTDFVVGQRHSLDNVQVIDERGCLTSACGDLAGIRRFEARDVIVSRLEAARLLRGKQDHKMVVPICSRSKDVIEYMVKPQWFVRCSEMASEAVESVRTGRLRLEPKQFERVWFDWLENIRSEDFSASITKITVVVFLETGAYLVSFGGATGFLHIPVASGTVRKLFPG